MHTGIPGTCPGIPVHVPGIPVHVQLPGIPEYFLGGWVKRRVSSGISRHMYGKIPGLSQVLVLSMFHIKPENIEIEKFEILKL